MRKPEARPILFSGPMVRALLEGRKTQTRRIVKPSVKGCTVGAYTGGKAGTQPVNVQEDGDPWTDIACPYGQPGDLLWVRETWCDLRREGYDNSFAYLANSLNNAGIEDGDSKRCRLDYGYKWKPSIHMPRVASRLTLCIIDVRAERLQDISEEDAVAEGCAGHNCRHPIFGLSHDGDGELPTEEYQRLWESINGTDAWDANPWVWVVAFDVIKANVYQVIANAQPKPLGRVGRFSA